MVSEASTYLLTDLDREEGRISITGFRLGGGAHIHYRIWTGRRGSYPSLN